MGVIESILWKVLKFMSFCIDFAKSLGLGHEWNGCGPNFVSFRNAEISWVSWILGEFSALELQTVMIVQIFLPFCYWKSSKFVEIENTCIQCSK